MHILTLLSLSYTHMYMNAMHNITRNTLRDTIYTIHNMHTHIQCVHYTERTAPHTAYRPDDIYRTHISLNIIRVTHIRS